MHRKGKVDLRIRMIYQKAHRSRQPAHLQKDERFIRGAGRQQEE
jgi:hypothetical protein